MEDNKKFIITASSEAIDFIARNDKSLIIEFKCELFSNMYIIQTSLKKEMIERVYGVEKVEENYKGSLSV